MISDILYMISLQNIVLLINSCWACEALVHSVILSAKLTSLQETSNEMKMWGTYWKIMTWKKKILYWFCINKFSPLTLHFCSYNALLYWSLRLEFIIRTQLWRCYIPNCPPYWLVVPLFAAGMLVYPHNLLLQPFEDKCLQEWWFLFCLLQH